jgi:hypothetical protein
LGHSVAIASLLFIPVPQLAFELFLIVLLLSAVYFVLRDARLFFADAKVALKLESEHIVLFNSKGEESVGKLMRSSLVMPQIVILHISLPNQFWKKNCANVG